MSNVRLMMDGYTLWVLTGLAIVHLTMVLRNIYWTDCTLICHAVRARVVDLAACFRTRLSRLPRTFMDNYVATQMQERQMARLRPLLKVFPWFLTWNVLRAWLRILSGKPREMNAFQDILWILVYCVVLSVGARPDLLRTRHVDAWYTLIMMWFVVFGLAAFPSDSDWLFVWNCGSSFIRLLVGLARMRTVPFAAWNVTYFIAMVVVYTSKAGCIPNLMKITLELTVCVSLTIIVGAMEQSTIRELHSDAQKWTMRDRSSAASALLDAVCDAQCELDGELAIVGSEASKLPALLLHGPGRTLNGVKLQDLMPTEEDRTLFSERMQMPLDLQAQEHKAEVFHLRLRDSLSSTLQMEVFSVRSRGFHGQMRHLIGMRELGDTEVVQKMLSSDSETFMFLPGEIAAKVDILDPSYRIHQCTAMFAQLLGGTSAPSSALERGSSFIMRVANQREFESWVQHAVNEAIADGGDSSDTPPFRVVFRKTFSKSKARVSALCSVREVKKGDFPVWLLFRDVRPCAGACDGAPARSDASFRSSGTSPAGSETGQVLREGQLRERWPAEGERESAGSERGGMPIGRTVSL